MAIIALDNILDGWVSSVINRLTFYGEAADLVFVWDCMADSQSQCYHLSPEKMRDLLSRLSKKGKR